MAAPPMLEMEIRRDADAVAAHRRAREVAAQLGFDKFEQTRVATAVSEIVRNALDYAGGGQVRFVLEDGQPQKLIVQVDDHGPGIEDLATILAGRFASKSGMGLGMAGARKLMDLFEVQTGAGGTTVRLGKLLPRRAPAASEQRRAQVQESLGRGGAGNPYAEIRRLTREMLEREQQLAALRSELEDTNRGVVTLYAELDSRAEYQEKAAALKTRLMSDMGHELRTPLHSLVSIAQFLLERLDGPLNDEQERAVRIIHQTARELTEFVNDLLDLAKAEAGRTPLRPADFTVTELFAGLRGLLRPLASNPDVALTFEDAAGLPPLWNDAQKLTQVLRNFISNALKFTERGEVRIRAEALNQDTVVFSVSDTGIGIDPKDHARIFEEFGQVENPVQKRVKGTGLGLALAKRLVTLMGGEITLRSALGAGSTFSVAIPRVLAADAVEERSNPPPAPQRPPATPSAAPAADKPTVLFIDDDAASRYVLRRYLEGRYRVVEATSGRDGLQRLRAERPDAIFLDLAMPDLTGYDVFQALRHDETTAGIPVVIYTAQTVTEEDRARLRGAVAIVSKSTGSRDSDLRALDGALLAAGILEPGRSIHG